MSRPVLACLILALTAGIPWQAAAQGTETVGTRAQGMAGAFVAVADDASAVYWNPAGLAGGAYFSFVLDGNTARSVPDASAEAGRRNGFLLALSMPALGLSYARMQTTAVRPNLGVPENSRVESLVTHQVGVTLVQSIADRLAVGATVKMVRGVAASAVVPGNDRDDLLDHTDLLGHASTRADVDAGVMFAGAAGRLGVTVRNIAAPRFDTGDGGELQLERQARAGAAVSLLPTWKLAADVDLTVNHGVFGEVRELALGAEGQVTRRLTARGGVRLNTMGDQGRAPALAVGASYAVYGAVLVDAQVTAGADNAFSGWGLAGRFMF
jgi:hypothetical protein